MIVRILVLIALLTATSIINYGQGRMEVYVNSKSITLPHPGIKVHDTDNIEIRIYLPTSIPKEKFLTKTPQAEVCKLKPAYQPQQQRQTDKKILIDLDKLAYSLSKKKYVSKDTLSSSSNLPYINIQFQGSVAQCPNKFFWVILSTNDTYKPQLQNIKNFESKIRFKKR